MSFYSKAVLLTLAISSVANASDLTISSNEVSASEDSKTQVFTGDVSVVFSAEDKPETSSDMVRFENGQTIMEGGVKIKLDDGVAIADKVTFNASGEQLVASTDKLTINYK